MPLDGLTPNPAEGHTGANCPDHGQDLRATTDAKHNAYGQPRRYDGGAELVGRESVHGSQGQQGCYNAGQPLGKEKGPWGDDTEDRERLTGKIC